MSEPKKNGDGPVLSFESVKKYFPVEKGILFRRTVGNIKAVDDVSFEISRGQTFALVGESGCGKTTIAKLSLLLERPTEGAIRYRGASLGSLSGAGLRAYRSGVQAVFQDPTSSLNGRLKVLSVISEPMAVNGGASQAEMREKALTMLEHVGLPPDSLERYPHEFSGGQRQRIAIARALVLNPELIVLDEAVSALDVSIQAQIINLLKDIQAEFGLAFLFVAHNLATVRYMSDRVAVMYLGALVETGSTEDVFKNRLHPYTQALLAAALPAHPDRQQDDIVLTGEVPSAYDIPSGCRFCTRCPMVMPICRDVAPPLKELAPGHFAACHLHEMPGN